MKTVNSTRYKVEGFNCAENGLVPRGWVLSSVNESRPETIIVDSLKHIQNGVVTFYAADGTVSGRRR